MNDIEIGDYVRTYKGEIHKVVDIIENREYDENLINYIKFENDTGIYEDMIVKHSKNIIDLIEVGDYVNGQKVVKIECGCYAITSEKSAYNLNKSYVDYQIKSILTHEQYEKNCFKMEEK